MFLPVNVTGLALVASCAVACATAPPQAAAPETPGSAAAPSAAASAPDSQPGPSAALLSQGYKPVEVDGGYVYCRMESMTGTRIRQKVCLTEADIRRIEAAGRSTAESIKKAQGGACTAGVNC